jgi:hypothetical protein
MFHAAVHFYVGKDENYLSVPSFILNVGRSVVPVSASSCPKIYFLLVRRAHFFVHSQLCTSLLDSPPPHPTLLVLHPHKCILRGEAGHFSYIATSPLPSETDIYCMSFTSKRFPKEVGFPLNTFPVFGFKNSFGKGWGEGLIHWFCQAMDLWCSWSFPGDAYEIAWRFWGLTLSNLCVPNYRKPPTCMG